MCGEISMSADPKTACSTASASSTASTVSAYQKQIMTTYGISSDKIDEITETELQAFEKRFYDTRTESRWSGDRWDSRRGTHYGQYINQTIILNDKRVHVFNLAKTYGFKALENVTCKHIEVLETYPNLNRLFDKIKDIKEHEIKQFEEQFVVQEGYYSYSDRSRKDLRANAYALVEQHGFYAVKNLTIFHIETMVQNKIPFDKMQGVTKQDIVDFPGKFYLVDNSHWRNPISGKDKRTLAYQLAKEYGFKRVSALNYYYLEAFDNYSLDFEQLERDSFCKILNESAVIKDKLLSLLRDRKDLSVKFVSTLSDPSKANQITLLRVHKLTVNQVQEPKILQLYTQLSDDLHVGFFNRIKLASDSEYYRILSLTPICIAGLVKYDLPLELVEDPKFTKFINDLPKLEYADTVLPLIKTHGFDKVTIPSAASLEGMSVLGLSLEQGASPEFQKFSKELGESLHSFEDLKAKGLFTKDSFKVFVKFDLDQIDAILSTVLNFNFEQVTDTNFHQFYTVYKDTWYKNLPISINQVLFTPHYQLPYQRIFRLGATRLQKLAENDATFAELEREMAKEDYGFTDEQVNDKSFAEALNQNLNIIAKWTKGQNLDFSRRIFALDANQLEALESEVDLASVENPGFKKFYADTPKHLRGETCKLVKSEGQKIWELSPLQFEARQAHKLETAVVTDPSFEPLFKEYYEHREILVTLIKKFGWNKVVKLNAQQFEAIFKHKLVFAMVTHPQFDNFYKNFLQGYAALGLELISRYPVDKIFGLTAEQANGIKVYNLTVEYVEEQGFAIVYAKEERLREMDFKLRKLELSYSEIEKLKEEKKTALLQPGYHKLSRLERRLFLTMVYHDLIIEEVEIPEYTTFCERIKNESLRIFAYKLITVEKKDRANICKRVLALNDSQLLAIRDHGFTLEQVEKSATVFAKSIENLGEKAATIIKDTAINRLYRLRYRHFKGMIKYELSLEDVEDPNFIRLYKNFIKTHTEMALGLIKTHGFKKVVALDLEQIQGIKEFGLSFEQVIDPGYLILYKAIKDDKHKTLLFKWVKEGLSYKEAIVLHRLHSANEFLELIESLLKNMQSGSKSDPKSDSKLESEATAINETKAAIFKLTTEELLFIKNNKLTFAKFKEYESLKTQWDGLMAEKDKDNREASFACATKILSIVPRANNVYTFYCKITRENTAAANAAKTLEKTMNRLQINQASQPKPSQPSQITASAKSTASASTTSKPSAVVITTAASKKVEDDKTNKIAASNTVSSNNAANKSVPSKKASHAVDKKASNDKVPSRPASAAVNRSKTLNRSPSVKSVVASTVRQSPNSRPNSRPVSQQTSRPQSARASTTTIRGIIRGANAAGKTTTASFTPLANMRRVGVSTTAAGRMTAASAAAKKPATAKNQPLPLQHQQQKAMLKTILK